MPRFRIDLRFIEIEAELWALGEFLHVIESQVQYLIKQDEVRMRADLAEQHLPWEDPEVQAAFEEHDLRVSHVFPRFLRTPFVVALCATYESAIEELAGDLATSTRRNLRLRDIRANSWLDSARKYFDAVLSIPLDGNTERLRFIEDLFVVRNAIAHANGQVRSIPDSKLRRLKEVGSRHPGVVIGEIVMLDGAFLEEAYENVNGSVRALVDMVRGGPVVQRLSPLSGP